jgi:hypothetical protein
MTVAPEIRHTEPAWLVLTALQRADRRWCATRCDDPRDTEYLRHLAEALAPLLTADATAVECVALADQLEESQRAHGDLARRLAEHQNTRTHAEDDLPALLELILGDEHDPDGNLHAEAQRAAVDLRSVQTYLKALRGNDDPKGRR